MNSAAYIKLSCKVNLLFDDRAGLCSFEFNKVSFHETLDGTQNNGGRLVLELPLFHNKVSNKNKVFFSYLSLCEPYLKI